MRRCRVAQNSRVDSEVTSFAVRLPKRHLTSISKEFPIISLADALSCARAPYVGLEGPVAICPQRPFLIFLVPVTWQTPWRPFMGVVVHALVLLVSPPIMICTVSITAESCQQACIHPATNLCSRPYSLMLLSCPDGTAVTMVAWLLFRTHTCSIFF